jgi:precorrin-6B C5,15-methyltransferase / cobalt-precorrin-6B C5,C15-methyltransferase
VTDATSAHRWLAILGIGEDGIEGLSTAASHRIEAASFLFGGRRHLALAEPLIRGECFAWPSPLADAFPKILAHRGEPVVVLASGDPYYYGIGNTLARIVPSAETLCIPAPSAFSLACARLGWARQDVSSLSFCGRPVETILPRLQPAARIAAFSADHTTPAAVAALLSRNGFGNSTLHIMEALGGPREQIRTTTASAGLPDDIDPLNLLAIEVVADPNARIIPLSCGLADALFEHDGQITKREIRAVTLSALAPRAGELLWDIGCGTGSIAIEWLLLSPANHAIAIESNAERAARAARNALSFGVPELRIILGWAPAALSDLPAPDAVFIGGGAERVDVVDVAWRALRPGGRMVVNAVTLETEALLWAAQNAHGGTLTRLSVARAEPLGNMRAFRPARPITQWSAMKGSA